MSAIKLLCTVNYSAGADIGPMVPYDLTSKHSKDAPSLAFLVMRGDKQMGLLDGLLGQLGGANQIGQIAGQFGISEEQVQAAVAALGKAHPEPGDTVASAAQTTGLSADTLQGILGQIGGEDALGQISQLIDRDGDGNPVNDIMGMAGKLFGN